jgi:hypothetical protein
MSGTEGILSNPELMRGPMQALASGGCLQDTGEPAGLNDPGMMCTIADFLFDAGILRGADGNPLWHDPDVGQWFTNACLRQEPALPSGARDVIFQIIEGRHGAAARRRKWYFGLSKAATVFRTGCMRRAVSS